MTAIWVSVAAALAAFVAGLFGLWLQRLLPEQHTSDRSRDMITAIVGLVSLLLALVLGTIIGSAYAFYSNQKTELETIAARALQLDIALAEFGPETEEARAEAQSGDAEGPRHVLGRKAYFRFRSGPAGARNGD